MKRFNVNSLKKETKLALINDENYPFDRVEQMLKNENNSELILAAINREDVTSEFLHDFVDFTDHNVRKAIALNSKTMLCDLQHLAKDIIPEVVDALIQNPNTSKEILSYIICRNKYKSINTMIALINNPKTITEDIEYLYKKVIKIYSKIDIKTFKEFLIAIINNDNVSIGILCGIFNFVKSRNIILLKDIIEEICIKRNDKEKFFEDLLNTNNKIYDFLEKYSHLICYFSNKIINIIFEYIKATTSPVLSAKEEEILINMALNKNISDKCVQWLINNMYYFDNSINIEKFIYNLLGNEIITNEQINVLWDFYKYNELSIESGRLESKFENHPNADKKIVDYLKQCSLSTIK